MVASASGFCMSMTFPHRLASKISADDPLRARAKLMCDLSETSIALPRKSETLNYHPSWSTALHRAIYTTTCPGPDQPVQMGYMPSIRHLKVDEDVDRRLLLTVSVANKNSFRLLHDTLLSEPWRLTSS